MASTSDIFGASLGSALAEPQNPITITMFGIVLFPSTYQPPPYCCFLGKTQRRKFLGQVICPCVWCFPRLQSVPQTHSVFQDLVDFPSPWQSLSLNGRITLIRIRLWKLPQFPVHLQKSQSSQEFSSSRFPVSTTFC